TVLRVRFREPSLFRTIWSVSILVACVPRCSSKCAGPQRAPTQGVISPCGEGVIIVSSFTDLGVPEDLVAVLSQRGIEDPFPVQSLTIPDLMAGRDVCGSAPTGSGKTIAFGVPLVDRVGRAKPKQPRALVLAPTRELAAQIQRELAPLADVRDRTVFTVYGGVGY